MNRIGIKTKFIIANAETLQKQWAVENGFSDYNEKNWEKTIVLAQLREFQPDFLWLTSIFDYYGHFIQSALQYTDKIVSWIGSPFVQELDVRGVSVLLTENPMTLRKYHDDFENVVVTKPGFDEEILTHLGTSDARKGLSFLGQISPLHKQRAGILAFLIENGIPIDIHGAIKGARHHSERKISAAYLRSLWQSIIGRLSRSKGEFGNFVDEYEQSISVLSGVVKKPLFGLDYYRRLIRSEMTLNVHIDMAENHAGNMRLFEATGVGTAVITENSENIASLFLPGEEVFVFNSKNHLLEIIRTNMRDKAKINYVATAGQKRILRHYTLSAMFESIKHVFE
jgi:hypothetical protein